jgi:hypothetical protein
MAASGSSKKSTAASGHNKGDRSNAGQNRNDNNNTDRTSSQGRKQASGGSTQTNNRGHQKGI